MVLVFGRLVVVVLVAGGARNVPDCLGWRCSECAFARAQGALAECCVRVPGEAAPRSSLFFNRENPLLFCDPNVAHLGPEAEMVLEDFAHCFHGRLAKRRERPVDH